MYIYKYIYRSICISNKYIQVYIYTGSWFFGSYKTPLKKWTIFVKVRALPRLCGCCQPASTGTDGGGNLAVYRILPIVSLNWDMAWDVLSCFIVGFTTLRKHVD
jgi:hypothetical protein